MQFLASADQMRRADRHAIEKLWIPGLVLMENAGRACVEELERRLGPVGGKSVAVVCGKGNNGGDGFVIARHLSNRGAAVDAILLSRKNEIAGDANVNLRSLLRLAAQKDGGVRVLEVRTKKEFREVRLPAVVVDAVFGTGFTGAARGIYRDAIEWINAQRAYVLSVDIPSGVDASTGIVEDIAVRARCTVTFALAKVGHYTGSGCDASGDVVVADISIPPMVFARSPSQTFRVEASDVRKILPGRSRTAHKYSVGKVFVIAGSRNFTGAPAMTALACLRSGAGAAVVGCPRSIAPVLARKLTEVIIEPLDETPSGTIAPSARKSIEQRIAWADVVVIGPGLSREPDTDHLMRDLVRTVTRPLVLDADGLNAVAPAPAIVSRRTSPTVLTPHAGELARLTGMGYDEIERDRTHAARKAARRFRCVLVLKGAPTATAVPTGHVYLNPTGNPGMATIGSGDVLTGLVAGLMAQGSSPENAAVGGVYLHGLAGDHAAEKLGERSLLATDILCYLPGAIQTVVS